MKEMKRMKNDSVPLGEIIKSKDDYDKNVGHALISLGSRLKSDLRVMTTVLKSQTMVIEKLKVVNEKHIEIVSAQMSGIQLQNINVLQLSCSNENMTRSSCPSPTASDTPNTVLNTGVIDGHNLESRKRILFDQQ
ncbi:hypothetical protein ACJMK2_019149 [Sinanodonta woodiana]|uniref:Uncharacterized protein n=1 Tax=Sinanodonta woodiana TaxID=1069815 RepID=A0ABD3UHL7_SINWO